MKSLPRCILATAIIALTAAASAAAPPDSLKAPTMLDSLDRVILDSALAMLKVSPGELGFDKQWAEDDTFRLEVVERLLDDPLAVPGYLDETRAAVDSLHRDPRGLLRFIADQLVVDPDRPRSVPVETFYRYDPADPFRLWQDAIERAEPLRRRFYADLDSVDLQDLLMAAPVMWSEAGDSVNRGLQGSWQREFSLPVDTSREVDTDRLLDIIKKLDMQALWGAALEVLPAAQATALGAEQSGVTPVGQPRQVEGVSGEVLLYAETKQGRMVVGGVGDNVYSGDFAVIIDIGGDDLYRGRAGGALGVLSHPYALVIDLAGDDRYDSGGLDVAQGAGFLGVGVLIDRSGDDSYRSGNYSQGAGFFGVGMLADGGGDDDLRGGFFLQGAGHCGVGLLLKEGDGDDRCLSTCWAQGFAGTFGYGLLYDESGDDTYRAGGAYLHEPLLPHDNRSFSGGFGMGWRPRAGGGIGVLYDDGDGNDFYDAEVMSLGSSYWYSIGLLIEGGGNDYYSLAHYGLGAGIHLSIGALYDVSGDDQYRSRFGVVGGTGHDLSVGMMVDGGGDDHYIVSDGWGVSLTNSVGLFIDRLGNDIYATSGRGHSFGAVRWARGFAGVGLFMDLEGDDVYPAGTPAADSTIWTQSGWGLGIDLAREVTEPREEYPSEDEIVLTAEDSAKSVEELWEGASQWEVGSAVESVRRARKALKSKGGEAVRWVAAEKLDTRSGLELRAIEALCRAYPDTAGPLLVGKLVESEVDRVRANAAYFLGKLKWEPAIEPLLELLGDKRADKVRNSAISALGGIGDTRATGAVERFLTDRQERRRITAVTALASIGDTAAIAALIERLGDEALTVRSAAAGALIGFGRPATPALTGYIRAPGAAYPEIAVRALGRIAAALADSSDARSGEVRRDAVLLLERLLDTPDEQQRAAAVESLYRLGGDKTRLLVEARMESEFSPVVKAAYARAVRESD